MAVVGMTEEEREGVEEEGVGEIDGRSKGASLDTGGEEEGGDTRGTVWTGGGEVSIVGGKLAGGKLEGTEAALGAVTVWG